MKGGKACTGGLNYTPTQRWNLLLSVGGSDLEDVILHQADIQIKDVPQQDPVQGRSGQEEIRDAQGNITQQYQAPVRAVIGRNAKTPTNWEEAIKAAIGKYSNEVMARYKLMFEMPASNYADWRKWGQELLEQAKRCKWEEYQAEQAALDALLYQCPNQQWKDKIMEGTLNFQEAINWGMTKLTAKQEGKKIGGKPDQDSPVLPVDKVSTETKTVECEKCFEKHAPRECPAYGYQCSKCHRANHLANSKECKKKPPTGAERPSRGGWQRGQRGRGGQGEGRGRGRGGPPNLSHE